MEKLKTRRFLFLVKDLIEVKELIDRKINAFVVKTKWWAEPLTIVGRFERAEPYEDVDLAFRVFGSDIYEVSSTISYIISQHPDQEIIEFRVYIEGLDLDENSTFAFLEAF